MSACGIEPKNQTLSLRGGLRGIHILARRDPNQNLARILDLQAITQNNCLLVANFRFCFVEWVAPEPIGFSFTAPDRVLMQRKGGIELGVFTALQSSAIIS